MKPNQFQGFLLQKALDLLFVDGGNVPAQAGITQVHLAAKHRDDFLELHAFLRFFLRLLFLARLRAGVLGLIRGLLLFGLKHVLRVLLGRGLVILRGQLHFLLPALRRVRILALLLQLQYLLFNLVELQHWLVELVIRELNHAQRLLLLHLEVGGWLRLRLTQCRLHLVFYCLDPRQLRDLILILVVVIVILQVFHLAADANDPRAGKLVAQGLRRIQHFPGTLDNDLVHQI